MKVIDRIRKSIQQRPGNIVLRADLRRIGSSSQVTEALSTLVREEVLVRIGFGVYAKTRISSATGKVIPAGSLETLASEAMARMGVEISPGRATQAYNSGQTTQLPGKFVLNTGRRRISRKLRVGGRELVYENNFR
jgi:uncharacterized protein DUF6088